MNQYMESGINDQNEEGMEMPMQRNVGIRSSDDESEHEAEESRTREIGGPTGAGDARAQETQKVEAPDKRSDEAKSARGSCLAHGQGTPGVSKKVQVPDERSDEITRARDTRRQQKVQDPDERSDEAHHIGSCLTIQSERNHCPEFAIGGGKEPHEREEKMVADKILQGGRVRPPEMPVDTETGHVNEHDKIKSEAPKKLMLLRRMMPEKRWQWACVRPPEMPKEGTNLAWVKTAERRYSRSHNNEEGKTSKKALAIRWKTLPARRWRWACVRPPELDKPR